MVAASYRSAGTLCRPASSSTVGVAQPCHRFTIRIQKWRCWGCQECSCSAFDAQGLPNGGERPQEQLVPNQTHCNQAEHGGDEKMERNKVLVLPFRLFSAKAMSKEIKITPISSMMV